MIKVKVQDKNENWLDSKSGKGKKDEKAKGEKKTAAERLVERFKAAEGK